MATNNENAIVVKLLNLLDSSQTSVVLPVVLVEESLANVEIRRVERVTELEGCGDTLTEFRVLKTLVNYRVLHLSLL